MSARDIWRSLESSAGRWLAAVVVAGVAARLLWCALLPDRFLWSDEAAYDAIGQNVAFLGRYSSNPDYPTAFRAPGQPFFLAGIYAVAGAGLAKARVAQSLLWAAALLLTYRVARTLGAERRGALLAAGVAASYPYYVYASGTLFPLTLATVTLLAATWALLRVWDGARARTAALAGALLGAAALAVPYAILPALAAPFWLGRRRLRGGLIVAGSALLVLAPWVARNAVTIGAPVVTTNTWLNFWYGNNDEATASSGSDVLIHPDELWVRYRGSWPDEIAMERIVRDDALAYVRDHPARTARLWIAKGVNFYRLWPETQSRNPHTNRLTRLAGALSFGPILLLGLWGWWRAPRRRRSAIIPLYFATFTAVSAVTISKDRFRMPLDVYLIIFAAMAAEALLARLIDSGRRATLDAESSAPSLPSAGA